MSTTSRVAAAVAAGYVFGRFKKLRMAVLVGSALSSDKVRNTAKEYVGQRIPGGLVGRTVTTQVGSKLADAGKAAVTSAAASSIGALSDRLAARTERLRGGDDQPDDQYDSDEDDDEQQDEPEDEYDSDDEYDAEEEPEDQASDDDDEADEADEADESDEPDDEYDEGDEGDEDDDAEEPVQRSPRRRRSTAPVRRAS